MDPKFPTREIHILTIWVVQETGKRDRAFLLDGQVSCT